MTRRLGPRERTAWLRLARTPGLGPVTFQRLLAAEGSAEAAIDALARRASGPVVTSPTAAEDELAALQKLGARLLCAGEADYPPLLAQLDAPPPVLTVMGNAALAARPVVGIVGAREASAAGLEMARRLAEGLGAAGQVIASGLARGIDAAAHAASLKTGTIAVLAGGLGKPYPPQNLALFEAICAEGLAVSEAPPFAAARGRDFPRRNHVISGLSAGIVVVEAAWRSGSLITARAAGDQGRDVMAVPGSPLDPRSRGTNALLKEGAILVETAEDVLAALASAPRGVRPPDPLPLLDLAASAAPGLRERLKALLSPTPVHVNALARHLQAPAQGVAAALTELEIEGEALSYPGGYAASSPSAGGA